MFSLDKPGAPEGPLEPENIDANTVGLKWKPPKDDGGAKILRYVIEKKPKGSDKWSKVPGSIPGDTTEGEAKNLDAGKDYDFRVRAVNENGESEPLQTDRPVTAKHPFGKLSSNLNIFYLW